MQIEAQPANHPSPTGSTPPAMFKRDIARLFGVRETNMPQATAEPDTKVQRRSRPVRQPWMPVLSAVLRLAGPHATLLQHSERDWASVTFQGSRHVIVLEFRGDAAIAEGERFIAALPEHEFVIAGQLVADATISSAEHVHFPQQILTVEAELLLLQDC